MDDVAIKKSIRLLSGAFTAPKDTEAAMVAWKSVLGEFSADELGVAVRTYMNGEASFFPKPGQLRRIITTNRQNAGEHRVAKENWDLRQEGPCPVCGASLRMLSPLERGWTAADFDEHQRNAGIDPDTGEKVVPPHRYGILHDLDKHARADIYPIGYAQ